MLINSDKSGKNNNHKSNRINFINDKLDIFLPELIARNIKLGDRLKGKLKVSQFLNNTENRNQKYLKSFISFSDKRVKDLKTGLELSKAVKQSTKNLSPLCSQISNDCILKNSDFLIEEKKLLNENTEQETHIKINELIQNLRNTVRDINHQQSKPKKKQIKSLSENEIHNIKSYINNKIKKEGNMINLKIKRYLDKLKNADNTDRKTFRSYIDHIDIAENLKLINYTKPKPLKIRDKECSSMSRIKKKIFPFLGSSYRKNNIKNKMNKKKYINMKNISNQNINVSISEINNSSFNEIGHSEVNEKDTLKVLNNLANNGRNLPMKISKSAIKVNSLVDINLPTQSAYEQIIKEKKNKLSKENIIIKDNFNESTENAYEIEKILKSSDPNMLSKNKLYRIANIFKRELENIKNEKLNFDKIKNENCKEKYNIINPLNSHLNKIKNYKHQNNRNENDLIKSKIKKINLTNNNLNKSNLFLVSKFNKEFPIYNNIIRENNIERSFGN